MKTITEVEARRKIGILLWKSGQHYRGEDIYYVVTQTIGWGRLDLQQVVGHDDAVKTARRMKKTWKKYRIYEVV